MPRPRPSSMRLLPSALALAAGAVACLAGTEPAPEPQCSAETRPLPLLLRMAAPEMCYPANLSDKELADLMARTSLQPPAGGVVPGDLRFFTVGTVWTGAGLQGTSGRALKASLTFSFPNDGVDWDGLPNTLNSIMTGSTGFGAGNLDRGRELIRQGLATWRRLGGLTYAEVADNNSARDGSTARSSRAGDIRIGGNARGTPNFLAYDYYPNGGADMLINTDYFLPANLMAGGNTYRYLRNVISHEHGQWPGLPTPGSVRPHQAHGTLHQHQLRRRPNRRHPRRAAQLRRPVLRQQLGRQREGLRQSHQPRRAIDHRAGSLHERRRRREQYRRRLVLVYPVVRAERDHHCRPHGRVVQQRPAIRGVQHGLPGDRERGPGGQPYPRAAELRRDSGHRLCRGPAPGSPRRSRRRRSPRARTWSAWPTSDPMPPPTRTCSCTI